MKLHLRNKVLVVLFCVALVPLVMLSSLGAYFIGLAQRYSVAQLETQLLTQKEKEIEKFIAETQTLFHVQVAAQVAALSGIPFDQREFLLGEIVKANRAISEVVFLEYDPIYPNSPEAGMEVNKMIGDESSLVFESRKDKPEFRYSSEGNDYFGPVQEKDGGYFMTLSSPVRNKDGLVIGVVAGELSLKAIERIIADGTLGSSGYLLLSDHKGVIWAYPQRATFSGFGSHVYIQSVTGGDVTLGETNEYVSSFGLEVVSSARKVRGLEWVLVAEWPKADAYELVSRIIAQASIFTALIIGIVFVASFLFAQRLIKPVRLLEEGTRIIGGGNLEHRIAVNTGDEFEVLALRFNDMAKNLKDIQELREIKARVQGLATSLQKEKELSLVKDQFIATASHQLRTPVSVLRWITESLRTGSEAGKKEEVESQLKDLSQNIDALALVIGDILTVAELGIGYTPKVVSEFSFLEKVKEAVGKYTDEAAAKHLSIALEGDEKKQWRIKASPLNISRALEHLVANAIVYTKDSGHILVEVSGTEKDVTFSIKDDGIGVPVEDQKLLFGEFFRAKNSVEMKNVGTGLGLFIVKTIIVGHGGTVGIQSPVDWNGEKKGARFYFTIPVR